MALLEIRDLRSYYRVRKGEVKAVDGVDFHVDEGQTVGLVGESGCGKTTMAFAVLGLLPSNARIATGEIRFRGELVYRAPLTAELRWYLDHGAPWEEMARLIERRQLSLEGDRHLESAEQLGPLFDAEASVLEDLQKELGEAHASPEALREALKVFLDRKDRSLGRNYWRKLEKRVIERRLETLRWSEISMIFQAAMNAFNPVYRVGDQIEEALETHMKMTPEERKKRVEELFQLVGMHKERAEGYPHEFSGGMKQRAMIAMALACNPDLILADEPTTALDVIMQDRILGEIRDLQRELHLAMIVITHDISVVAEVSNRIVIMYAGEVAEEGLTEEVFERPAHPYTMGLLEAFPSVKGPKKVLKAIPGSPPDLVDPPPGCRFHPRCRFVQPQCAKDAPPLVEVTPGHRAHCHFAMDIFGGKGP